MASNSSAAAVAALFGIREGHQQDQMKPLLAQQQRQHVVAPPSALLTAGPDQAAAAAPPVKKKRTMPDPDAEVIALSPKTLMATNRRDSFITHRAFCDALAQESARLPPGAGHLYGATGAANMALSLSQGKPFHGLMQLPDLQGNGSGGTSSSAPGLFNLGYIANSGNSSGTSSHGHASQGHMANDQISEGGGGGGAGSENSGAAFFSAGGNFSGGDHQFAPSGMYNEQSVMMPQMSATALLQKAAQMGSSTSADGGGASVFGGFMGSSVPQGRAPMLDQGQMHLQSLMNSLAGGGNGGGMFGGANGRGMIDPRLYDMDQHEVKFSQGRGGGVGGGDVTRDFLGVGGRGDMMRGMSVARGENHSGSNMSFLEAEMKSASSPFNGGRMQ
ncbi:unnamed protein product [Triticum turgidum subsp. durum]|uniref:BIRD-IDD transcription factor fourth C2HC zinc finger domain-containing protein n=1 Tax=Triticum turgidum subsp. durum TaxID=4567 RepID=A0A9R1B1E6_TRITD|nr:unnamed protein product [Triticum turgidum subsp. durum]